MNTNIPHEPAHKRGLLARINQIRELIASGSYPNSTTLAATLEVSKRTIKRDLELLRDRLNLEIEFDTRRNGFYIREGSVAKVNQAEMFTLMVAQKVIQEYQGTPLYPQLAMAFNKMTGQLDTKESVSTSSLASIVSVRRFAPEGSDVKTMDLVSQALCSRRAFSFEYRKPGHTQKELRRIHPYHLMEYDARWYVLGRDSKRKALRTFALTRMSTPKLTNERFERPVNFDPKAHLSKSVGIMEGSADYQVVIEMDPWLTDMFRGRRFNDTQDWTLLPNGGSVLRVRVDALEEITRWVLGWGHHATVIQPQALRDTVANTAKLLSDRYLVSPN